MYDSEMKLYYVHDPMCSWCWAFRPVLLKLTAGLPTDLTFIRLLGGLAPDSNDPMPDKTRDYVIDNWRRIQEQVPETSFNYQFWKVCQPRRSTYPACRAVIAAKKQGSKYDEAMTYAIQKAYYLQARNPSDNETLIELASEIGLHRNQFCQDLLSKEVNEQLMQEIKTARKLKLNSFPSLLLLKNEQSIRIQHNYLDANMMINEILEAM